MRNLEYLIEPLLQWYYENKRVLPWRENNAPYRVWVSEIMLQQTRVEAVKPYFERFLRELPDVSALAEAEEDTLLKLWEGLGYYNRVRNMQKAARCIVEEHNGSMPADYEVLLTLPGIGPYTAGAVASISFQQPVPAVDGNVLRILARVSADDRDIQNPKVKKVIEQELLSIMPKETPGDFNQALMELGAIVCIPNGAPKCDICPWRTFCEAKKQDKIATLPVKAKKKERRIEEKTVLLIRDGEKTILQKRANKGLLAGLYEFPSLEEHKNTEDIIEYLEEMGYKVLHIQQLPDAKHIFSHIEWRMRAYAVKVQETGYEKDNTNNKFIRVNPKETEEAYPIPSAFAAYVPYVDIVLEGTRIKLRKQEH